jgi:hypothetical protein
MPGNQRKRPYAVAKLSVDDALMASHGDAAATLTISYVTAGPFEKKNER